MFDAVRAAIRKRGLPSHGEFVIKTLDATDLTKLKTADLVARGFDDGRAETIHSALSARNFVPLGQALGVSWKFVDDAASLLDN